MITNLKARVAALEKTRKWEPTILTMPDGSTRSISGPGDYRLKLLAVVCGNEATPEQEAQLDLIGASVSEEPSDGIAELIRALLNSPTNPPEYNAAKTL
jgi:hypothetical protein